MNDSRDNGILRAKLIKLTGELLEAGITLGEMRLFDYAGDEWFVNIEHREYRESEVAMPWSRDVRVGMASSRVRR